MFEKTIHMYHLTIHILTTDEVIFHMLDQYPDCKSPDALNINIIVKDSNYSENTSHYHRINHHFNVSKDINIQQYVDDNADIILRNSPSSRLRIDRKFSNREIYCNYEGDSEDCRNFLCSVVETFIANILYTINFLPLHGAVLQMDGFCLALCGESFAGKSTTALQLLAQGASLLSNDLFYLDLNNMLVYSLDKTLGVRETSYKPVQMYFEYIKNQSSCIYSSDQQYYDMQKLFGDRFVTVSKLDAFFILKKDITNLSFRIGNKPSIKQFMDCCIFPSPIINNSLNFINCYRIIEENIIFRQLELPDFSEIKLIPSYYIVEWPNFKRHIFEGGKNE